MKSRKVSRREFLKKTVATGAVAVGSATLIGCMEDGKDGSSGKDGKDADGNSNGTPDETIQWDESFDVVIVGGGGAGLVAGIEAADAGATVLLLEKRDEVGGSTGMSGGVVQASGTIYQEDLGITNDNADKHFDYWFKAGENSVDQSLVRLMADNSKADIEWLGQLGLDIIRIYAVDPIPYIDPNLMLERLHVADGGGNGYVEVIHQTALNKGVEIRTATPVSALIYSTETGVSGVELENGKLVQAKRAVVMASGGYDRNEEMARTYSPQLYWDLQNELVLASDANTGDGIRMGMNIGADLAGMGGTIGYPALRIGRAENDSPIPGIWVNKYGQRFVNEAAHYGYASRAIFDQEEHIVWAVFDETVKEMGGALIGGWSSDLSTEIASGLIKTGNTVAQLAAEINVNAAQLDLSLTKWNSDMDAEQGDTLFGKLVSLEPLDTAPYYATRVLCYNVGSCGGLRINSQAQVLNLKGQPIPRLYAAGMTAGGFIGPYYPGSGTAVTSTLVFGRIAGQNAAAESEI